MYLSPNFTLSELTKSSTAQRLGLDNTPDEIAVGNLQALAQNILQPCRNHFGIPFTPSSGYRSIALCEAIGSSAKSQHAKGEAADFEIPSISNLELAKYIRDNLIFDQLILEYYNHTQPDSGWVHCSYSLSNRREVLTFDGDSYGVGIDA